MKRGQHIFGGDDACVVSTQHTFQGRDGACSVCTGVIALIMLLALTACDSDIDSDDDLQTPPLTVTEVHHTDDHKHYDLYARVTDVSRLYFDRNTDTIIIEEFNRNGDPVPRELTGEVKHIKSIGAQIIDSLGVNVAVLVDLTLPQNLVDSQLLAIRKINYIYSADNLFVNFLHADSLSDTYLFTDYIANNLFVSEMEGEDGARSVSTGQNIQGEDGARSVSTGKKLYRAIYKMMSDFQDPSTTLGALKYCSLVVFSDGNVYGMDETPIDPDHYQLQTDILSLVPENQKGVPFFYVNFDNSSNGATNDAENFLQLLAERTHGGYNEKFHWSIVANYMFDYFELSYNDYIFQIDYPSDRLFDGKNTVKAYLVCPDSTYLLFETSYMVGNVCKPVIIDGESQTQVILRGIIIALILVMLIYLVCQFIIPYIQYRIFRRRHVTTYQGPNTTLSGIMVGDTCYYCKAPFRKGESVVAKCQHTMHEGCWRENDYHCPEYGRKCPDGSHYYNDQDLFDPRNAWFYMPWVIGAVVTALLAWIGFILFDQELAYRMLIRIYAAIKEIAVGTPEYEGIELMFADTLDQLPSFGAFLGFVFTFMLGWQASDIHEKSRRLGDVFIRAVVSGINGYLFFLLGFVLAVVFNLGGSTFGIDWIPWTGTAFVSVFAASYGTGMHPHGKWFFGMVVVGIISMFAWDLIFSVNSSDYRLLIFASNLIFALGVSLSVAQPVEHSGKYVLRITGGVKESDVALYKWFRRTPSFRVTIGKSIDCAIQMSWDIQGDVAAVHAEVVSYRGQLYLVPLEDGVFFKNRMLAVGKRFLLYHGRSFTIGTTTFTFHERDLH